MGESSHPAEMAALPKGGLTLLAGNAIVYVVADALSRGVPFILIPLYAAYMSAEEYGLLGLLSTVTILLVQVLGLGLYSASMRFYYQFAAPADRRQFFGAMWITLAGVSGLAIGGIELLAAVLPRTGAFADLPFDPYVRLAIWTAWWQVTFRTLPQGTLRVAGQPWRLLAFSVSIVASTVGLVYWRLVVLDQGLLGAIRGNLEAAILTAGVGALVMMPHVSMKWSRTDAGRALAYGVPLIPHHAAQWLLGMSDRYLVGKFASAASLGVYHLGYQFASAFQVLGNALNSAMVPLFSRAGASRNVARLPRVITYYVVACTAIGLAICLLGPLAISIMTPPEFHEARRVVPWTVLGVFALCLYAVPMNVLTLTDGRTSQVAAITLFAGTFNVSLNVIMIPRFGMMAAATSMIIAYTILLVGVYALSRRQPIGRTIQYEFGRIGKIVGTGITVAAFGSFARPTDAWAEAIVGIIWLLIGYPVALWIVGTPDADERRTLTSLAFRRRTI